MKHTKSTNTYIVSLLCILALSISCGSADTPYSPPTIGEEVTAITYSAYSSNNRVLAFDNFFPKINVFNLEQRTLESSIDIPEKLRNSTLYSSLDNPYLFFFATNKIFIRKDSGELREDPIKMAGTPTRIASLPSEHLYLIIDDLGSLALLQLDEAGETQKSYIGGSFVSGKAISTGALLSKDLLVLIASDGSIININIAQTFETMQWSLSEFSIENFKVTGLIPAGEDRALLQTEEKKILLVDTTNYNVLITDEEEQTNCKPYYRPIAFYLCTAGTETKIIRNDSDREISKTSVPAAMAAEILYLEPKSDFSEFTVLFKNTTETGSPQEIVRIRTSDGLIAYRKTFDTESLGNLNPDGLLIGISGDYILALFNSPLGFAKVFPFSDPAASFEMHSFNKDMMHQ